MIRKYCAKTIEFVALNLSSRSASVLFFTKHIIALARTKAGQPISRKQWAQKNEVADMPVQDTPPPLPICLDTC
jgi:hypothetical protein